ncbi:MAG: Unknown [Agrocybe praecox tulasvirus 1]|nr:MAG: Unknown [Agrocybe praecox tulasvirus 1]
MSSQIAQYYSLITVSNARNKEQMVSQSKKKAEEIAAKAVFVKSEVGGSPTKPFNVNAGAVIKKPADLNVFAHMKSVVAAYGRPDNDKYWFLAGEGVYVSYPEWMQRGTRGAVATAYNDELGEFIEKQDNNMIKFLERCGLKVEYNYRKFCFSKGYYLAANKESALKLKEDIDKIIELMRKNKGVTTGVIGMEGFKLKAIRVSEII